MIRTWLGNFLLKSVYRRLLLRDPRPGKAGFERQRRIARWAYYGLLRPFYHGDKTRDLVCVVPRASKGWILEAICREIIAHYDGTAEICYDVKSVPDAKCYFLAHYMFTRELLTYSPHVFARKLGVFYTHPRDISMSSAELVFWLNQSTRVFAMNAGARDALVADGVLPDKVVPIVGAADPDFFPGHDREPDGAVGFCSAFYERKDPDRILEIVQSLPHRHFILTGRNWEQYARFDELRACKNFEYLTLSYQDYPAFYRRLSVFVSPSILEGGPIPLVESMMENVVPVASATGFAPDLIDNGANGYLFPTDASASEICPLIERAFENTADVRETVLQYSWKNYSQEIMGQLGS